MNSPYYVPTITATPTAPNAPSVAPMPPTNKGGWRVALVVLTALVVMAVLAASLTATASAARTIAYPTPHVGVQMSVNSSTHVGDQITFQAIRTAGRDLNYHWDFSDGGSATGASVTHVFTDYQQGGYTVALTATDPLSQQASVQRSFTLLPPPPIAAFTYQSDSYNPLTIYFDASQASGVGLSYQWDFGDGQTSQDQSPSVTYARLGTYTVRLTVTDTVGQTASTTQQVVVQVTPPTASFTATQSYSSYYFGTDVCYSFDASASTGYQLTYRWDFGDGNTESDNYSQTSHCYYNSGSYHVTLTVVDGVNQSQSTSQNISF